MLMSKSTNGFTIVELLIAIVVIGILASVTVVAYSGDSIRDQDIKSIAKALEMYYVDNGQYPSPPVDTPCVNESFTARSGCASWNWLATQLQPYTGKTTLPMDPINTMGSTTDVTQHSYYYSAMQNNNDWPLLCAAGPKQFQAYYLISYKERGPIVNQIQGSCSNPNPYFGSSAGVYANNYLVVR